MALVKNHFQPAGCNLQPPLTQLAALCPLAGQARDNVPTQYAHIRRAQVGELLREKIALILMHKSRDPRLHQLSITGVDVSDDLRQAKVYYITRALDPELSPEQTRTELAHIQTALDKAVGFIKQEIAQLHVLRFMPQLTFSYDKAWQRGMHLEQLLAQTKSPSSGDLAN